MTDIQSFGGKNVLPSRPLGRAMRRGASGRCPHCGEGRLFSRFLKVEHNCKACGEDLHHHQADDLPAYLVIFIVGHLAVGGYMLIDRVWLLEWWQHLMIWAPFIVTGSLLLLPAAKGATVGAQWAMRMHGFGEAIGVDASHPPADAKR